MFKYRNMHLYYAVIFFIVLSCSQSLKSKHDFLTKDNYASLLDSEMQKEGLTDQNFFTSKVVSKRKESKSFCNKTSCGSPFGYCMNRRNCQCNKGFVHAPFITGYKAEYYCRYQQRRHIASFLLELFFPLGAGHFYSLRIMIGFFKLLYFYLTYFVYGSLQNNTKLGCFKYLGYIFVCSFFLIHCLDLGMIGYNKYLDGNGIPLYEYEF